MDETVDPVESADLEPIQRSLDRMEEHLRAIRTYTGWLLAIVLLPILAWVIFMVFAVALGATGFD